MNKVYPERINWEDEPSVATPLSATNLNKIDYATYEMDNRVIALDTGKANQVDELLDIKEVSYNSTTGVWTFTHQNGTTDTFDQNIEKIPVTFSMDENGVITMTTADGTTYTCDVGTLIKTYTFVNSGNIQFTVTTDAQGNKSVTASVIDGSITRAKLDPDYLAQIDLDVASASASALAASGSATAASGSATTASNKALDSEAYALGTRGGVPVTSDDPAYENNSKYYAEHGASSLVGLTDTNIVNPTDKQALVYDEESEKWVNAEYVDSLENLTDVDITSPEEGDVITYNSKTEKWENKQSAIGNTSDDTPYLSRETNNGNRVGSKRVVKDLVGGSVVANQLTNPQNYSDGGLTVNVSNGQITINGSNSDITYYKLNNDYQTITNHVYLLSSGNYIIDGNIRMYNNTGGLDIPIGQNYAIQKATSSLYKFLYLRIVPNVTFDNVSFIPQVFDLTAMFGTTVTDTLYSMEQATAGSGVALFRQLFPNDYYAYQIGTLVSVKPSAMISGGKTYPISEVDLRGLLSLSNGKWVYDGDIRTCGGEITRKYGIVDLGSLTWTREISSTNVYSFKADISNAKGSGTATKIGNILCALYVTDTWVKTLTISNNKSVAVMDVGGKIAIQDDTYSDATTFKTAMDGVYLIYELATPTTENVPAFSEIQDVTENGTESFTDARTFPIPVAHHTDYPYGELGDTIFDSLLPSTTITYSEFLQMSDAQQLAFTGYVEDYKSSGVPFLNLVSWSTGTDEEITAMVNAFYNNEITLDDIKSVWHVGDSRTITLSAMSATGVGESHRSQDVEMVILDFEHDDLTTAINGHTKSLVSLQQKDCLRDATVTDTTGSTNTENGYMNSTNTNAGGWKSSARRTWCNNVYYNALPSAFKSLVKSITKQTTEGSKSTTLEDTEDNVWLPSEYEIYGVKTYSAAIEGSQYKYYETANNRNKLPKWNNNATSIIYWLRSPFVSNYTANVHVNGVGNTSANNCDSIYGIAPAVCI